ncbi:hypothetical protein BH11BAC1_BH11BAC1_00570 [soil metagenome]
MPLPSLKKPSSEIPFDSLDEVVLIDMASKDITSRVINGLRFVLGVLPYLNIPPKKESMSLKDAVSASALYCIGRENFFPVSVAAGLVKACVAFA